MSETASLEVSCWAAACQALAAVAPRYGLGPERVREICEDCAQPRSGDHRVAEGSENVLVVQRIVVGLIENISEQGANRELLLDAAQDAFEARRKLILLDRPSEIMGWA
jgi:hypothetical protein